MKIYDVLALQSGIEKGPTRSRQHNDSFSPHCLEILEDELLKVKQGKLQVCIFFSRLSAPRVAFLPSVSPGL